MNIILLYSEHRHVAATDVAIFRMESAGTQIYLYCVGITPQLKSNLVG